MKTEYDRYLEHKISQLDRESSLLRREYAERKDREFHERLREVGCEYEDGSDFGD